MVHLGGVTIHSGDSFSRIVDCTYAFVYTLMVEATYYFTSCKDQGLYRLSLFQLRKGPDLSTCAVSQYSRNASHCFHCRQNGDVPFFLLHSHSLFIATVVCCHVVNPPRVTLTWLYLGVFSRNVYPNVLNVCSG